MIIIKIKGIATTALLLAFASGPESSAQQTGISYKPATDADSKKTILLRDFHPEPTLHAAVHEIPRAKFPVIDVHTHTNDAVGIGDRVDPKEMIAHGPPQHQDHRHPHRHVGRQIADHHRRHGEALSWALRRVHAV